MVIARPNHANSTIATPRCTAIDHGEPGQTCGAKPGAHWLAAGGGND